MSNLANIPQLHFIENIPLDYMHLLCLGVMRKCFHLWLTGDLKIRLQYRKCQILSNMLETVIKQAIPIEFCRKPRSLDYLKQWKATEYRQILLYTGSVVNNRILQEILSNDMYYHFLMLYVATRILFDEDLCKKYLDYAKKLLKHYVKSFKILYGEHNISHNIHNLIHLCDDVRIHGTLNLFSVFKYENFLQEIKKLIRKTDKPLQQLHRRFMEKKAIRCTAVSFEKDSKIKVMKEHYNGPIINNCTSP
jgi:CRISPR/Cas system-associated protein Csx1